MGKKPTYPKGESLEDLAGQLQRSMEAVETDIHRGRSPFSNPILWAESKKKHPTDIYSAWKHYWKRKGRLRGRKK